MSYVDFEYYTKTYHGTAIPSASEFDRRYIQAEAYFSLVTYGREIGPVTDNIKNCICELMDVYQNNSTGQIASETVGRYSRTFTRSEIRIESMLHDTAYKYLANTGLLYGGPC